VGAARKAFPGSGRITICLSCSRAGFVEEITKNTLEDVMDHAAERPIETLLARYGESHRNHTNEVIHFVCIPAIMFSLLGLLWAVHPYLAVGVVVASMVYYFMLSVPFAVGMLVMSGGMLWVLSLLPQEMVWKISLVVFVLAWIGQFVGHKIEGKKPSFFEDVRFLLIGPVFVLGFVYRGFGIGY
jgi:uncharacterized membrane protein YGL010W